MSPKEYFFDSVIRQELASKDTFTVLELGCGTAPYVPAMLSRYPNLTYIGVEPNATSFKKAQAHLKNHPRARIVEQLGYDEVSGVEDASCDLVISFSVLEHVKHLEPFIRLGSRSLKKGGLMVHRYDLGHALYPQGIKEHLHVWLGNHLPWLLPERTFVRYVPQEEVARLFLESNGIAPHHFTYHNMPNHKRLHGELLKIGAQTQIMEEVVDWECSHSEAFGTLPVAVRERLFPTVAVWGRKS